MTPDIINDFDFENFEIDLSDWDLFELIPALEDRSCLPARMTLWVPLPCFGSTQSHADICGDLVDASYAAELLGRNAMALKADFEQTNGRSSYKLTIMEPTEGIWDALKNCALLFNGDDEEAFKLWGMDGIYIAEEVAEFAENIDRIVPVAPDIIDHYYMNLIHGVYGDSDYEETAKHGLKKFPERRIGYCRSAVSRIIHVDCYVGTERWAVPSDIDFDRYFEVANEKFRLGQFQAARQHIEGNNVYEFGTTVALCFSFDDLVSCRNVSRHLLKRRQPKSDLRLIIPSNPAARKRCLIHETGAAALFDDGIFCHIFYGLNKLSSSETLKLANSLGDCAAAATKLVGSGHSVTLPWHTLDDDQFESLCYDIIWLDPRFDETTIKKMGKSRSRDGGRDIVVCEKARTGKAGRKWIFQCKLIRDGSSLTPSKLQNIGDMLDQYNSEGFGMMTSTVIDATLYDRVEAICKKRCVSEGHFSIYELERLLYRHQGVRNRYFSTAP